MSGVRPDRRQLARNRILDRILEAEMRGGLSRIPTQETAENILTAIEALGWTPPEGAQRP
jgi:hypothetical protein